MKFGLKVPTQAQNKYLDCLIDPIFQRAFQGSVNCVHGDEHACKIHAKWFSHARNCVPVNQSKYF